MTVTYDDASTTYDSTSTSYLGDVTPLGDGWGNGEWSNMPWDGGIYPYAPIDISYVTCTYAPSITTHTVTYKPSIAIRATQTAIPRIVIHTGLTKTATYTPTLAKTGSYVPTLQRTGTP